MGTGKRRISLVGRGIAARVVGNQVLAPELARVAVQALVIVPAAELALVIVPVAVQAPVLVQGVAELEHARAVAELERDPAVAALEHGQAVAPVQNLRRDQLEARRRTRSATEARRRDLARLLAVEDSAAVVETTRDPAATEAGIAWAAAG